MNILKGVPVCDGVAIGTASIYRKKEEGIPRRYAENGIAEREKYDKVRSLAIDELDRLFSRAKSEIGEKEAQIFSIHKMMVEDMYYNESVLNIIEKQKMNAETAVLLTSKNFETLFRNMDNAYMRERASDVKDVSDRIVALLRGKRRLVPSAAKENTIIFATNIAPSEAFMMDKSKIVAFVTEGGNGTSHTAILARSLGIPAVAGIKISANVDGKRVAIDGYSGVVYIEPDEKTLETLSKKAKKQKKAPQERSAVTKSGRRIRVLASIERPEEVKALRFCDCDGVGIFRSDALFKESEVFPGEEYQFDAYRKVLEGAKEAAICTLDIDAAKKSTFFGVFKEENAEMGMSAIRLCLKNPKLFKTQLRAVLKASVCGKARLLLPMITTCDEVKRTKKLLDEAKTELRAEGADFDGNIPLGIVIETPAAAVISDELARLCDFFLIDADKLAQYMLAMDRKNIALAELFDRHHRAVMQMIRLTAENAHKNGIKVGICGGIAAEADMVDELLRLGIDGFSVATKNILNIKNAICESE